MGLYKPTSVGHHCVPGSNQLYIVSRITNQPLFGGTCFPLKICSVQPKRVPCGGHIKAADVTKSGSLFDSLFGSLSSINIRCISRICDSQTAESSNWIVDGRFKPHLASIGMTVSGLKMGLPPVMIHLNGIFRYKPLILGYPL